MFLLAIGSGIIFKTSGLPASLTQDKKDLISTLNDKSLDEVKGLAGIDTEAIPLNPRDFTVDSTGLIVKAGFSRVFYYNSAQNIIFYKSTYLDAAQNMIPVFNVDPTTGEINKNEEEAAKLQGSEIVTFNKAYEDYFSKMVILDGKFELINQ